MPYERTVAVAGSLDRARRLLGAERRRGQGRADRRGDGAPRRRPPVSVRRRHHGDRIRHRRRTDPRCRDRGGPRRVRARAALRRDLGTDHRRAGRRADPAGRGSAPTRMDRAGARARGPRLGGAAGRSSPGHVAVLPTARRPLRRRQLPARADRDVAARPPRAGRIDAAVADAVHPRRLRPVRGRGGADVPGAFRTDATRRSRAHAERDVLVHAGRRLDRWRERDRARHLGVRGGLGDARGGDGAPGRRVDGGRRADLRPGRGRREPVLPVPVDGAVRDRTGQAAVPRGLRHHPPAPAAREAARLAADALLRASRRARGAVRDRRRLGAPAMVRGEPPRRRRRDARVGAPGRLGCARSGPRSRAASTLRCASAPACSTSPRT